MSKDSTFPYKALRPLGISGRVEKGQVVYLTELQAKAYASEDLAPYKGESDVQVGEDERELDKLSLAELKEKAAGMGLKTGGSKTDLIERIQLAGSDEDEEDEEDEDEDE